MGAAITGVYMVHKNKNKGQACFCVCFCVLAIAAVLMVAERNACLPSIGQQDRWILARACSSIFLQALYLLICVGTHHSHSYFSSLMLPNSCIHSLVQSHLPAFTVAKMLPTFILTPTQNHC